VFDSANRAFIAVNDAEDVCLNPKMANRHGLITGATGTGKTVTLQNMAETFSRMGAAVFAADVKGDLSGVAVAGGNKESVVKRVKAYGLDEKGFVFQAFPVQFWDLSGERGAPVRAAIGDMGPLLLGRLLELNDTQSAVLTVVFKIAEDESLELIDLKDLRKVLEYAAANAARYSTAYGNISGASVGAIQRSLVALEQQGAGLFFGEPALDINDLLRTENGRGVINILASDKLMRSPRLYSTFLLWLLDKLFTVLPELGDPERPKLVFFFDEAHMLFDGASKALLEKVEQVARLIRSKGVGVYFISQSPADIPDSILGQLGNRVQHALRAYTPKDQRALKAAAQSFRPNPAFSTGTAIAELGMGEALLSFLDEKGAPRPVERAFILPPEGRIGPLDDATRRSMLESSPLYRFYADGIDRRSAYETLSATPRATVSAKDRAAMEKAEARAGKEEEKARQRAAREERRAAKDRQKFWTGIAKNIVAPVARQLFSAIFKRR
jgi:DNA helicase HerA-like ATPase